MQIFELSTPFDVIAGRELHLLRHGRSGVAHIAAEIAAREIDIDVSDELRVLGADPRRTLGPGDVAAWPSGIMALLMVGTSTWPAMAAGSSRRSRG